MPKLSRAQKRMLGWVENGHWLIIGDRNRVYVNGSLIYAGMRNTLESLERLGLVEKTGRSLASYRKPKPEKEG